MDHRTCRDNLSAYLDGELSGEEKSALESHLAGCAECRKVLDELRSLSLFINKHAMEPVPLALKGKVFAKPEEKRAFYAWLKPALAASMAAAGVLLVLNVVKSPEFGRVPLASLSPNAAADLKSVSQPEESPLPPLPRQKLSEPEAGILSGSGLESLDIGAAKSDKSNAIAQKPLSFAGAGTGGGGARAARSRPFTGHKAETLSLDKAAAEPAAAGPAENTPSAPLSKPAAPAAKKGAFGQAKFAPDLRQEAEDKGKGIALAPAAAAVVRGSADRSSLRAERAVPVEGFILDTYTVADERYGKKAANRFRAAAVGAASEEDRPACDDYAEFVLDDGTYCILPDSAGKEFLIKRFKYEGPQTGEPVKQLWDVFEYGGDKYLLLNNTAREGKRCFEYYLLGPRRIRLQGEIELSKP